MLTDKFLAELSNFSKANWWVYIAYVLLLGAVFFSGAPHLASVALIPSLHFVADIFIMMMLTAYLRGDYREGAYYQIVSMLIFLSVKVYTGLIHGGWHYLAADPIYILAAIKNYRRDVSRKDLKLVNSQTMTALSVVLITTIVILALDPGLGIVLTPARYVQMGGIFLFAIALTITDHERQRYELSMVALTAMVVGSGWELLDSLESRLVAGLALSYFLLPLTVLLFYSKKWSYYMANPLT
ncbi:MAG TPA: hypothetical protein VGN00_29835 [Puia sp.]|jgi:hypothetical protein